MLNESLDLNKSLDLNRSLQQKKQAVRKQLAESGPVKKDKKNEYSKYSYLSEAKYKELFTKLLSENGLELSASCVEEREIQTGNKSMGCGRIVVWDFTLSDVDTGFTETMRSIAEGWDSGDKAIYKAHTGALKYFLANTFMVASGDEVENDEPPRTPKFATPEQVKQLKNLFDQGTVNQILSDYRIQTLEQLSFGAAAGIIEGVRA